MSTRMFIVMESFEGETYVVGAHLSRHAAREFIRESGTSRKLFMSETTVVGVDENTYLSLQRQLSRVQNRLGKARRALREARKALKAFQVDKADGTIVLRDPVYAAHLDLTGSDDA